MGNGKRMLELLLLVSGLALICGGCIWGNEEVKEPEESDDLISVGVSQVGRNRIGVRRIPSLLKKRFPRKMGMP